MGHASTTSANAAAETSGDRDDPKADLLMPDPALVTIANEPSARHACGGASWTVRHDNELMAAFADEVSARQWVTSQGQEIAKLATRLRQFHEIAPAQNTHGRPGQQHEVRDWDRQLISTHSCKEAAAAFVNALLESGKAWDREITMRGVSG